MPTIRKFYHRGNNDAGEGDRLTAVFELKLIIGTEACRQIEIRLPGFGLPFPFFAIAQETGFFLPDLAGDDAIAFVRDQTLRLPPSGTPGGREQRPAAKSAQQQAARKVGKAPPAEVRAGAGPITICLGDVRVTVVVDIGSPLGAGNGEAQAGPIAAQFGLEHNGAFQQFIGGPLQPNSEHWHVSQTVQVATIPCTGGAAKGSLKINSGLGAPAAYEVSWDVVIAACGAITKSEIVLTPRAAPPGLGAGGLPDPPIKEVAVGDPLPYPLKNGLPGGGAITVGPGGQPVKTP